MKKLIAYSLSFALSLPTTATRADTFEMASISQKSLMAFLSNNVEYVSPIEANVSATLADQQLVLSQLIQLHESGLTAFLTLADFLVALVPLISVQDNESDKYQERLQLSVANIDELCKPETRDALLDGLRKIGANSDQISRMTELYRSCGRTHSRLLSILPTNGPASWLSRNLGSIVTVVVSAAMAYGGFRLVQTNSNKKTARLTKGEHIKQQIEAQKAADAKFKAAQQPQVRTTAPRIVPAAADQGPLPLSQDEIVMGKNFKRIREAHEMLKRDKNIAASNLVHALLKEAAQPGFKLSETGTHALRDLRVFYDHLKI